MMDKIMDKVYNIEYVVLDKNIMFKKNIYWVDKG